MIIYVKIENENDAKIPIDRCQLDFTLDKKVRSIEDEAIAG